jgi:hypothetical protein
LTTTQFTAVCGETSYIVKEFKDEFKEVPFAIGKSVNDYLVIFWKSLINENFSVTISSDKNMTCLVVAGEKFKFLQEQGPNSAKPTRLH